MRTFRHHLAITGRPRKSRVVTDPARVDADRPKRVVRRTLNEYHSHLMAGPRLHSQLTHRALFKLLLAPPMIGSCRPPAVHRLKPKGRLWVQKLWGPRQRSGTVVVVRKPIEVPHDP